MGTFKFLRAVLLLPVPVTLLVPGLLLALDGEKPAWSLSWNGLPFLGGLVFILLGLFLSVRSAFDFAAFGQGTPAPWDPPRALVVRGLYRYVRNPMISGVFAILLGEALLFGSRPVFLWFLAFLLLNWIYIPLSEERGLERRFGQAYLRYKKNVPRWIPRLRPWDPPQEKEDGHVQ